jgi:acetyl-CoA carboxylase carboxyl transferase subunit alpha
MSAFQLPFEKRIFELEEQLSKLEAELHPNPATLEAVHSLRMEIMRKKREVFDNLDAWEIVQVARHQERPQTRDYIELLFGDEFIELHGDRAFGDDQAIVTGLAKLEDEKVMFIGQHKGRTLAERQACYYGCAHPEGYRKALLKMNMAAKYGLPIICLIDTPGAYPGIGAEERGQAHLIAVNLREMSRIGVPIACVVIGEGGSGGALGIGIGDYVAMLQFSYYSVISPEGCAGILWKDRKYSDQAAKALKFSSRDLKRFGIIDEVIPEPLGGAHRDHRGMANTLKQTLLMQIRQLSLLPKDELLNRRYRKFRAIGEFEEGIETGVTDVPVAAK